MIKPTTSFFNDLLNDKKILFSDGATGTNLQNRGLTRGLPSEVWVLENPEAIVTLHRDFIESGADIILTCTFGASPLRLKQHNLDDKYLEINQSAVKLAKEASQDQHVMIAASIGPSGQMLKPLGTVEFDELKQNFSEQAKALDDSEIDFFLVETQFDLGEANATIEGILDVSHKPIICSFSYDRGLRTMMGVSPTQMYEELKEYDLLAIGINCGKSLEDNLKALQELAHVSTLPIWFKPNAGLPKMDTSGRPIYDTTPVIMGVVSRKWVAAGSKIIGGCCGTSPQHLKVIITNIRSSINI